MTHDLILVAVSVFVAWIFPTPTWSEKVVLKARAWLAKKLPSLLGWLDPPTK